MSRRDYLVIVEEEGGLDAIVIQISYPLNLIH